MARQKANVVPEMPLLTKPRKVGRPRTVSTDTPGRTVAMRLPSEVIDALGESPGKSIRKLVIAHLLANGKISKQVAALS